MFDHYCHREDLEEFAVQVHSLSNLLIHAGVQRGDAARDTVALLAANLRGQVSSLLTGTDGADENPAFIPVDSEILTMACFGVLHALRAHEDGRETAFEQQPWETLVDMFIPLTDLARIPNEADQERVRRRILQRAYFSTGAVGADRPTAREQRCPAVEAPARVGVVRVSAEQLADLLEQLEFVLAGFARRGPYPRGLGRILCAPLSELNEGLAAYLQLYSSGANALQVHNPRSVATTEAAAWISDIRQAIREADEKTFRRVAQAVRASLESLP